MTSFFIVTSFGLQCNQVLFYKALSISLGFLNVAEHHPLLMSDQSILCSKLKFLALIVKDIQAAIILCLVPYRFVTGGNYSFLLLCLSVFMSVCPSPILSRWFSRLFFLLLADIQLIFGTLLCHTKLQIKFEFGFDPFIFHLSYGPWTQKIS